MMKRISLFISILFLFNLCVLQGQTDLNIPIQGICIYVDYPDAPANVTRRQLEGMINGMDYQEEGVNRSFRKYWHQETRRNIDIQHDIFFYTAPHPTSYYSSGGGGNALQLFRNALEWIIANNPQYDWSSLSQWSNSDPYYEENPELLNGAVKSAIVISSAWGPTHVGGAYSPNWTLSNGVKIGKLQTSALQTPWWNTPYNLFMVIHESAHAIFDIPDTYDQDGSSSGTGKYSLMSAQGPDVEPIGAPFLYLENWGHAIQPTNAGIYTYTLRADGDSVVVLKNIHDPEEFFVLEVRKNTTPGNSLFPVPIGLMIWHTDGKVYSLNMMEDATRYAHYRHSIIQKDGLFELEGQHAVPDAGDIYLPGDNFSDRSNPDANWWAGEGSGISIKRIQIVDENHMQITVVISNTNSELNDF
ncbi:MAG: hypothetical protein MI922_28030, partial [Bacteroidales bacterium]|nr:hypothetical protein [Bacteroidales bacterium]